MGQFLFDTIQGKRKLDRITCSNVSLCYVTPISSQIQLQIPLPTYPLTLISGQIPPTYLPLDV
eukprot:Pgem_evm1s20275